MHVEKKEKVRYPTIAKACHFEYTITKFVHFCLQLGVSEWIFVLKSLQWLASVTSLCAQCAFLADFLTKSCNM